MNPNHIIILSLVGLAVAYLLRKKAGESVLKARGKQSNLIIISTATGEVFHASSAEQKQRYSQMVKASGGIPLQFQKS